MSKVKLKANTVTVIQLTAGALDAYAEEAYGQNLDTECNLEIYECITERDLKKTAFEDYELKELNAFKETGVTCHNTPWLVLQGLVNDGDIAEGSYQIEAE